MLISKELIVLSLYLYSLLYILLYIIKILNNLYIFKSNTIKFKFYILPTFLTDSPFKKRIK